VLIGGLIAAAAGRGIQLGLVLLPAVAARGLEALALKLTLSMRGLARATGSVGETLTRGDLPEARRLLAWHLVSRPTEDLDEPAVAAAAVESVAENASDSAVAPLLCYAVAGLPGALAYRFINTADAMLGYRDGPYGSLGKAPARLDDVLNWIPARLTAGAMLLAAPLLGLSLGGAGRVWHRDRAATASPNAGRPMSAAAGALGVELSKPGDYVLGSGLRAPAAGDVSRAIRLMYAGVLLLVAGLIIAAVLPGLLRLWV
jgi:adenosylcobinamide-phosphate synthase